MAEATQGARAVFMDAVAKSDTLKSAPEPVAQEAQEGGAQDAPQAPVTEKALPTDFDELLRVDPDGLSPERLKDLQKNLNKGFTQNRQKDAERVRALEAQVEQLKGASTGPEWVQAMEQRFEADPEFAKQFTQLWRGGKEQPAATPRRSEKLNAYLDRMETPEDRESTKQLYDVVRQDILDEVTDRLTQKDQRIAALEAQLKDGAKRVSEMSEEQRYRATQEAAQRFRAENPQFEKLSETQKESFVALLNYKSSRKPDTDPSTLFREWYADLEGIGQSKVQEHLSSLKDRAGKVPPPPAGQAGTSTPEFRAKGPKLLREIFDHHRGKVQGL